MEFIETSEKMGKDAFYWTTMGEISDVIGGGTPPTSVPENFVDGDIPWITPADLSGYTEKFIAGGKRHITGKGLASSAARMLPAGTVLFTSRAPIGYVAIAKNTIATNQGFKSFVLKQGVLPEYVYWWLKGSKQAAESLASGTTFLEISGANAKKLPIPMVSLARQHEIVAEIEKQFSRLDEAVANLQRVKANLKRYKASVLKDAVEGRLVPTEAELARREGRSFETGGELLLRILETRRKGWKGKRNYREPVLPGFAEFSKVPEGWAWASPDQLSAGEPYSLAIGPFGSSLKVSDYTTEGVPLVFVRNIRAASFGGPETVFVSPSKAEELRAHIVEAGDILITKMGAPPGDVCMYLATRPPAVITADCIKLRLTREQLSAAFFTYVIESKLVQSQIQAITKGVAQLKVSLGNFSLIGLPLPPAAEQRRIVEEIDRRLSLVSSVESEVDANLKRAQALRQATLQRAFSTKEQYG